MEGLLMDGGWWRSHRRLALNSRKVKGAARAAPSTLLQLAETLVRQEQRVLECVAILSHGVTICAAAVPAGEPTRSGRAATADRGSFVRDPNNKRVRDHEPIA